MGGGIALAGQLHRGAVEIRIPGPDGNFGSRSCNTGQADTGQRDDERALPAHGQTGHCNSSLVGVSSSPIGKTVAA
ncbi:hypothetical protein D3C86_2131130 [compost metagenome]